MVEHDHRRRTGPSLVSAGAVAFALLVASLVPGVPAGAVVAGTSSARSIRPPVSHGTLKIAGDMTDGGVVEAKGLSWAPPHLPSGDRILSFQVAYDWQACAPQRRALCDGIRYDRDAVRREPVHRRPRGRREAAEVDGDRDRGGGDRSRDLLVQGRPRLGDRHDDRVRAGVRRPGADDRVRQRDARAAHRLDRGVLPGRTRRTSMRPTGRRVSPPGSTAGRGRPCHPRTASPRGRSTSDHTT